jgi:hypothetical protein
VFVAGSMTKRPCVSVIGVQLKRGTSTTGTGLRVGFTT